MHTARAALCTWTLVMNRMRVYAFAGSDELGKGISSIDGKSGGVQDSTFKVSFRDALRNKNRPLPLVRYR